MILLNLSRRPLKAAGACAAMLLGLFLFWRGNSEAENDSMLLGVVLAAAGLFLLVWSALAPSNSKADPKA